MCLKHINALPVECQTEPGWPQTGTGFVLHTETLSEQKLLTKSSCSDRKPRLTVRTILVFWWGMIYSEVVVGVEESDADIFFSPVLQNRAQKNVFFLWCSGEKNRWSDSGMVVWLLNHSSFICSAPGAAAADNSLAWWCQSVVGQFCNFAFRHKGFQLQHQAATEVETLIFDSREQTKVLHQPLSDYRSFNTSLTALLDPYDVHRFHNLMHQKDVSQICWFYFICPFGEDTQKTFKNNLEGDWKNFLLSHSIVVNHILSQPM